MSKRIMLIASVLVLTPLIAAAQAISFKTDRGNLYSAGASINITENASNDIVAAGGSVIITGSAGNEVLAAGGSIVLSGKTGGDVRAAAGNLTIAGEIGGEAVLAGGKVNLLPKSVIKDDLMAASGEVSIEGDIGGRARIIGGTVIINGTIHKDAEIRAERLVIGSRAVLKGTLRYEAPEEARIEQGAVITGQKLFTQKSFAPSRPRFMEFLWACWIIKLISTIAAALIIYFALKEKTLELTALALNRFGRELLVGFIVFIVIPAFILLLFISLIGWVLALLIMFFYIAFVMTSTVLGALVFTRLMSGYLFKRETSLAWPVVLLGVLTYQIVGLIPFLGWIMKFVFFLSAFGALSELMYGMRKGGRPLSPGGYTA